MCYFMYGEPSLCWYIEPFYIYQDNYDEFFAWIEQWPEAYAQKDSDGRVFIMLSDSETEYGQMSGDYMFDLPTMKCGPDHYVDPDDFEDWYAYYNFMEEERGNWWVPEPAPEQSQTDVFLHELSWRVAVGETCVVKLLGSDIYNGPYAYAYAIVGGEAPPRERIVEMDLDEVRSKAADLAGGRLMIGYHPDSFAAE